MEMNDKFRRYAELLKEWNEKMNLTAITDDDEIKVKHFQDSLTILPYITGGGSLADIGTGAGFPGLPVAIERPDLSVVLVDALNKRISFLECVVRELGLTNVKCVHARAEDFGRDPEFRGKFDYVTARAVASMPVLAEYCLPLLKEGGHFIAMKGPGAAEEDCSRALKLLGGRMLSADEFVLEGTDMGRCIIDIEKTGPTPKTYPRKAGLPSKKPL